LTVKQVRTEKCPSICTCPNKTVAICKDLLILPGAETFETNLTKIDFSGNKIISAVDTFSKWNVWFLHSLNLSGNRIMELEKFAFNGFTELEDLDLSRNNISFIDETAFVNDVKLSSLWLTNNSLTEIHTSTFSLLDNLRNLDLSNNIISSIEPETFRSSVKLESLCLANNKLTSIHPATFKNQSNLSYLDLSGNKIWQIKEGIFYYNTKLESLLLADNYISEFHPSAFHTENELSYIDISGNRIEELENLTFCRLKNLSVSRNSLKLLGPRSFSNCKELLNLSLAENNISEINYEAFYGLEKLEYLDLSRNNITDIISSFLWNMLHEAEVNNSGSACVSKMKHLKLANNEIYSFNFKEYLFLNISHNISIKFCKLELLDLSGNCLSALDDTSVNLLRNSTDFMDLEDSPWLCDCSSFKSVYEILDVDVTLNCATPEYLKGKRCPALKYTCHSITSTEKTVSSIKYEAEVYSKEDRKNLKIENMTESEPVLRVNIFIFGIYASTICVTIVVVLVITRAVGKPEPDEFWWEDKLAKRNY
jgi:Leucine-rich repeat (LRR) protein